MEYYSAIKKNKIMSFAATWMDLEIVIMSEVYASFLTAHHPTNKMCHFLYHLQAVKSHPLSLSTHQTIFSEKPRPSVIFNDCPSLSPLSRSLAFETTFLMVDGKALLLVR